MREADRKRERRGIDSENDQHLRFNFYLIRFFSVSAKQISCLYTNIRFS